MYSDCGVPLAPRVGDHVVILARIVGDVAHVEGDGDQARLSVKVTGVLGQSPASKAARAWRGAWVTCPPWIRLTVAETALA